MIKKTNEVKIVSFVAQGERADFAIIGLGDDSNMYVWVDLTAEWFLFKKAEHSIE